jgi:hypothetical protein
LQFRLRTLLLLIVAAGVGMFFYTRPEVLEEQATAGFRIVRQVDRDEDNNPINHGSWELFDPDGRRVCQGQYRAGRASRRWTYWHANGRPWQQGEYRTGQRHGLWSEWYETGQPRLELTYADGVLHGPTRAWSPEGQLSYQGQYEAGERGGQWTIYNSQGQKTAEGSYLNDSQDGTWLAWDDEGRSLRSRHYSEGRLIEAGDQLLKALRLRLHSSSHVQRSHAIWALGQLGHLGMPVLEEASRSTDENARVAALLALIKQPRWAASNVPRLAAALDEESDNLQRSTLLALSSLGPAAKEAAPNVERLLGRAENLVRSCALATLVSLSPERDDRVEELVRLVDGSGNYPEWAPYLSKSAMPGILRATQSPRSEIRWHALSMLGFWADRSSSDWSVVVERVAAATLDRERSVRLQALNVLTWMGTSGALAEPYVLRATKDSDAAIAQAAQQALDSIRGKGGGGGLF